MLRIPLGFGRCLILQIRRRCRHDVLGICPRCYPTESRTLRNRKLALALAWLERIGTPDPYVTDISQLRGMAQDGRRHVADITIDSIRHV